MVSFLEAIRGSNYGPWPATAVSLFTEMSISALNLPGGHFEYNVLVSYVSVGGQFYQQREGVALRLPVWNVIAGLCTSKRPPSLPAVGLRTWHLRDLAAWIKKRGKIPWCKQLQETGNTMRVMLEVKAPNLYSASHVFMVLSWCQTLSLKGTRQTERSLSGSYLWWFVLAVDKTAFQCRW
jgi:hypothetical protein